MLKNLSWLSVPLCAAAFVLPFTLEAQDGSKSPSVTVTNTSNWNGYTREHFVIDGHQAWVTLPKTFAPGRPWLWRARFPGFHDEIDHELLKRGFATVHVNTENLYGAPKAMNVWDHFYQAIRAKYELNPKGVLDGVSRGGLFIYNFANRWPERVAFLYGDTPALDFKSWPGGRGVSKGSPDDWNRLKQVYGFASDSEALASQDIPMNYAEKIAAAHIPVYHVIGPVDQIVPPSENTHPFAERFRKAGGRIVIHENKGPYSLEGHHFPLDGVSEAIAMIVDNTPLPDLPGTTDWFIPNDGILTAFNTFEFNGKGRVLYFGGSITENPGWQNKISQYLQERFPNCKFEFKNAGIGSHDSFQHAFRRSLDAPGKWDLVFFEAAVNDLHNSRTDTEQSRGYEGFIRGIIKENPNADIVCLNFAEPRYNDLYHQGKIPPIVARHTAIANHYRIPVINLAKITADRIKAGQFDWGKDFRDLHPSPFGQVLYYQEIVNFLDGYAPSLTKSRRAPRGNTPPLFPHPWENGKLLDPQAAVCDSGFEFVQKWTPEIRAETRGRYVNCPMLVGKMPGAECHLEFEGTMLGVFTVTHPADAADVEVSIDGGAWKRISTRTAWSLHLPFAFRLADDLQTGKHTARIRIPQDQKGKNFKVWKWMVNG